MIKKRKHRFSKKKEKELLEKLHENKKRDDFLKNSNSKIDSNELEKRKNKVEDLAHGNANYEPNLVLHERLGNLHEKNGCE